MSKHKTIKKWVAILRTNWDKKPPVVLTAEVDVIETQRQYRLTGGVKVGRLQGEASRNYRIALEACGYRTLIHKSGNNCPLHDTEKAALVALNCYYVRQLDNARVRIKGAEYNHDSVAQHLEQKYADSDESNPTS